MAMNASELTFSGEANAAFRWYEIDSKLDVIVFNESTTLNAVPRLNAA